MLLPLILKLLKIQNPWTIFPMNPLRVISLKCVTNVKQLTDNIKQILFFTNNHETKPKLIVNEL